MHPWIGAGDDDRRRILDELGLSSVDALFSALPEGICVDSVALPEPLDEHSITQEAAGMALANVSVDCQPFFLGAGVYRHLQPSVVDSVLSRAEFFTSYTPYQPEISQGTLQAIFEFQTLMCQLTDMEVANASLYDGATALVEACLFAHRIKRGKRPKIVLAETVHPMYRQVLNTYTGALGLEVVTVAPGDDGRVDFKALAAAVDDSSCCVAVQSPNFLGVVEELAAVAEIAHGQDAMAVHVVGEAVSLGLLKGGGAFGFDVVCGEAQSFGVPAGFGGPHLGFFACNEQHVRQMPGRLVGLTVDEDGRQAFCLTLSTREQHIRRAKATSNICTNQGLMALVATVWLQSLGGRGLRELATACLSRGRQLAERITALGGQWRLAYAQSPYFNELLVLGPKPGESLAEELAAVGIVAGLPSRRFGGSWPDGLVMAATECTSNAEIDALIEAMGRLS